MGASCSNAKHSQPISSTTGSQREAPMDVTLTQHRLPPPSEPILEPDHPNFTPSINAQNRYPVGSVYDMGQQLGSGTFGTVFLSTHKTASPDAPWAQVALKQARLTSYDTHNGQRPIWSLTQLEAQVNEIRSLLKLRQGCRNVVCLYEYYLAGQEYFLVTELLDLELDEWKSTLTVFTEDMARKISRTLLQTLVYMHSKGTNTRHEMHSSRCGVRRRSQRYQNAEHSLCQEW